MKKIMLDILDNTLIVIVSPILFLSGIIIGLVEDISHSYKKKEEK